MSITTFSQTLDALNLKSDAVHDTHAVRLSQLTRTNDALEQSLKDYADKVKTDLLGDPLPNDALNTLRELATALGNDDDIAANITTAIANETTARENADTALAASVNSEAESRAAADNALGARITTEAESRAAADNDLGARIGAEADTRAAVVNTLHASIATEAATLAAADTALGVRITAEEGARAAAVDAIHVNIATEAKARGDADDAINASIAAEAKARGDADTDLKNDLENKIDRNNGHSTGTLTTATLQVDKLSYMYIGDHWRIKATSDGSQLVFEYAVNGNGSVNALSANWEVAVPFITHSD